MTDWVGFCNPLFSQGSAAQFMPKIPSNASSNELLIVKGSCQLQMLQTISSIITPTSSSKATTENKQEY